MEILAAVLLTYLLHSTLLLSAAALACACWGERRLALQEALLRAALLGGFITAGAQVAFDVQPWGGVVHVAFPTAAAALEAQPPVSSSAGLTPHLALEARPASAGTRVARLSSTPWPMWLAVVWGLLALAGLARLASSAASLRLLLRGRRALQGVALVDQAARFCRALGLPRSVPLSSAPALSVPLATGLWRGEVCLPERALRELPEDDQGALCAHELAHVARRDPAWILVARLAAAVAPLQPLNHWARRRLHDLAECLSDDLAASISQRPAGLARSLVDVASWTVSQNPLAPVGAVGALSTRSRLAHRVERLMDPARTLERPRRLWLPLLACAVLGTAFLTPVVSGVGAQGRPASVPKPPRAPLAPIPHVAPVPQAAPLALALPGVPQALEAPEPAEAPEAPEPAEAPEAPQAPEATPRSQALERAMETLQERIEARLAQHQGALHALEADAARIAARVEPRHDEFERFGREVERAARALAEQSLKQETSAAARAAQDQARQQLEQAKQQLHALTAELRLPLDELRQLSEQARELAEAARPSDDELRDLRRLAEEMSRQAFVSADEARRLAREAAALARADMRRARQQSRRAPARVEPSPPEPK